MNKVKILLSAIIILTLVGGVFALKAKKRNTSICTNILTNGACSGRKCMGSVKAMIDPNGTDLLCVNTAVNTNCTAVDCAILKRIIVEE